MRRRCDEILAATHMTATSRRHARGNEQFSITIEILTPKNTPSPRLASASEISLLSLSLESLERMAADRPWEERHLKSFTFALRYWFLPQIRPPGLHYIAWSHFVPAPICQRLPLLSVAWQKVDDERARCAFKIVYYATAWASMHAMPSRHYIIYYGELALRLTYTLSLRPCHCKPSGHLRRFECRYRRLCTNIRMDIVFIAYFVLSVI